MNIASFVTIEDFPRLLKCLIEVYEGTIKSTTSVLVIAGETNSGKGTLIRIIKTLAEVSKKQGFLPPTRHLQKECFMRLPNANMQMMVPFKRDIVICEQVNDIACIDRFAVKFHTEINNGEMECRELYCEQRRKIIESQCYFYVYNV